MMMALGIAGLSLHFVDGYTAGFFHLMSHAMFKASLFMGAGALLHSVGSRFMTDMGGLHKYMKKTYLFMLLAGLSLAGAPLITSGFWSKDAIFAAVLESGYSYTWPLFAIAVVVAVMTAFYTFRMIGMAFFGNKSKHLEEMEHGGHQIHEVHSNMWLPFAILAVATVAVGVVGFAFADQIHSLFKTYLATSFAIKDGIAQAGEEGAKTATLPQNMHTSTAQEEKSFLGLNPIAAIASVGAFGIGAGLGYVFYIGRKADPEIISKTIVTRALWRFLYNRWYLNSGLYWATVIGPLITYRVLWRYFESAVIDGISPAFQYSMTYFSRVVRAAQTGITQTYLFIFAAGIMIIVMLLFL
jgi:NADH-quinone oxidoreductase subunit L